MGIIWRDHRATAGVGCVVPQGSIGLGLQGRAHRDGIGRVGRRVQRDLGGGGGVTKCGMRRCVGWRAGWSIGWGNSRRVGGPLWRGVGCCIWGKVGGGECGGIRERVGESFRRRVRGWAGQSRPGGVRRGRFLWIRANYLAFGHVPHLIVPVQQLQGATHSQGNNGRRTQPL